MARSWPITFLVFIAFAVGWTHAGEKDVAIKGTLTKDDGKDQQRGGAAKSHVVKLKAGNRYTIHMAGTGFDAYLRLLDAKGKQLEEDDDSGGGTDAQIIFNCNRDADFTIVCTTFAANQFGEYVLQIKIGDGLPRPVSAHAQMLGRPAPDFQADFALNGKQTKLADFKGKTVLLHFIDVRSTPSAAFVQKLVEWKKAFAKDGVLPVAVTFYPSDIGQALALEADGKLKTIDKADRKSDRALFKAYAAHYKIDYPILAMSKQNALDTFDSYVVNGYPLFVLIDRTQVIRMMDVGGEKSAANIETEIKKLLK